MKIAVHGKKFSAESKSAIQEVFEQLKNRKTEILVSDFFEKILKNAKIGIGKYAVYNQNQGLSKVDFIISLGGDGTLLETVCHVGRKGIPIVGINTGRLGFLATTPQDMVKKAIDSIYNNYYEIEERAMLNLESDRDLFGNLNFGLNEFAILKRDTSSMIVVHAYIDGEYLNSYWSDGLIVATPTGSTGYSLSCGGPVILPHSNNFIITPVSPHNLNVRPLIVSDKSIISFEIEGRGKSFLVSLDSRSQSVDASVQLAVRKEKFFAKLVKINGYNFLDTLRTKLNWGLDMRN